MTAIPVRHILATLTCEVICLYNQIGANTYNSIGGWLTICPAFFELTDEPDIVSVSQMLENGDSC